MKQYIRALTIAGSDSGGGAGIQADLKTFSALGCYGMSVLTAVTAQNTQAVTGIHPLPPDFVAQQIDAVLQDIGADVLKIGMLHSSELIVTVAERLKQHNIEKIVVDPVMIATSGDKLLEDEAIDAMRTELFPLATIITPNLPEAACLLGRDSTSLLYAEEAILEEACRCLADFGPQAVLIKGGHSENGRLLDLLYEGREAGFKYFRATKIESRNTHGTGCTLSSAIAARLAIGESLSEAVEKAKEYISGAILAGSTFQLGHGHGPVHHFYRNWE